MNNKNYTKQPIKTKVICVLLTIITLTACKQDDSYSDSMAEAEVKHDLWHEKHLEERGTMYEVATATQVLLNNERGVCSVREIGYNAYKYNVSRNSQKETHAHIKYMKHLYRNVDFKEYTFSYVDCNLKAIYWFNKTMGVKFTGAVFSPKTKYIKISQDIYFAKTEGNTATISPFIFLYYISTLFESNVKEYEKYLEKNPAITLLLKEMQKAHKKDFGENAKRWIF